MEEIVYDKTGTGYNRTRTADDYITNELYNQLNVIPNSKYLDIGCGTGNYTIALSNLGLDICGVDPSTEMLKIALAKDKRIEWKPGSAEKIPYPSNYFSGVVATLTVHHWSDLSKAFKELNRILTDKGTIVLFTSTPEQMKGYWLNYYFPAMLQKSIEQMPSVDKIKKALVETELTLTSQRKYFITNELKDHFLYTGKNRPGLYFEETIRTGISSFSNLANSEEVRIGLSKLKSDIETGKIQNKISEFNNEHGDYLFIRIEKNTSD